MELTRGEKAAATRMRNKLSRHWPEAADELAVVYAEFIGTYDATATGHNLLIAAKHPKKRVEQLRFVAKRLMYRLRPPTHLLTIFERWASETFIGPGAATSAQIVGGD